MTTAVETAHPPLPNGKRNYIGSVLPIYGCAMPCEVHKLGKCWLKCKSGTMTRQRLGRFCEDCKTMKPHIHMDRLIKIKGTKSPRVWSGHMAELADFKTSTIEFLEYIFRHSPQHLFQPFTHRPLEFYTQYPKWSDNVWCCGTWTSGVIAFPGQLECGVRVAYCEPVLGEIKIADNMKYWWCEECQRELSWYEVTYYERHDERAGGCGSEPTVQTTLDWLVIGLLNHCSYAKLGITLEQLAGWIKPLMAAADALSIPIFMKSHKLWEKMGIEIRQEWPK